MIVLTRELASRMLDVTERRWAMSPAKRAECRAARTPLAIALRGPVRPMREFRPQLRKPNWQHDKGSRS